MERLLLGEVNQSDVKRAVIHVNATAVNICSMLFHAAFGSVVSYKQRINPSYNCSGRGCRHDCGMHVYVKSV